MKITEGKSDKYIFVEFEFDLNVTLRIARRILI